VQAVLDGVGIAQLPACEVCGLLRQTRLVSGLTPYAPDDRGHYVRHLSRKHLPARIRASVDYMAERVRALDLHCASEAAALPAF